MHGGFYQAARRAYELMSAYLDKFYAGQNTGLWSQHGWRHRVDSGADATQAFCSLRCTALHIRRPRAADATFVKDAGSLVHHRMVNHDDPVPCTPGGWMNTRLSAYGAEDVFTFERVPEGFGGVCGGANHSTGGAGISITENGILCRWSLDRPGLACDVGACERYHYPARSERRSA